MTTIARHPDSLREVEAGTRQAWHAYRDKLAGLSGEEYEAAEHEAWEELQLELAQLERRRQALSRAPA